jgi:2-methylcitrate dehydratase
MKKFCSLIHGQPVLEAVLKLKRGNKIQAADVASVTCDIFETGYVIAGGGAFGPKDFPQTKEQADYNLKYLISAALLDDQVGPDQLEQDRVRAEDAQALLKKVQVREDPEFTSQYPNELNTRIVITTKDGKKFAREQRGYEGGLGNPFSWERTVEKFHWLSEPFADGALRTSIIETVETLDQRPISDLMKLLAAVKQKATYPAQSGGIQ